MKKYLLFFLLILLSPVVYGVNFNDDFENWAITNINGWTYRYTSLTNQISTTTEQRCSGRYGLKVEDNSTGSNASFERNHSGIMTLDSTYYARIYAYFPDTYFSTFSANNYCSIFHVFIGTGVSVGYFYPIVIATGRDAGSNNVIALRVTNKDNSVTQMNSATALTENKWYCIEFMCPTSSGSVVNWWLDNIPQSSGTISMYPFKSMSTYMGFRAYETNTAYQKIMYMDTVVIDVNYIGMLSNKIRRRMKILGQ